MTLTYNPKLTAGAASALAILVIVLLLAAAMCGGEDQSADRSAATAPERHTDTVPSDVEASGTAAPLATGVNTTSTTFPPEASIAAQTGAYGFLELGEVPAELDRLPPEVAESIRRLDADQSDPSVCAQPSEACSEMLRGLCDETASINDRLQPLAGEAPILASAMLPSERLVCASVDLEEQTAVFNRDCEDPESFGTARCAEIAGRMCEAAEALRDAMSDLAEVNPVSELSQQAAGSQADIADTADAVCSLALLLEIENEPRAGS